jgi:hypothetical protein
LLFLVFLCCVLGSLSWVLFLAVGKGLHAKSRYVWIFFFFF